MKKLTLISGITSSLLVLIGVIFKTLHWPGASIALTIGIVLFALVYALFLFNDRQEYAKTSVQKISNVFVLIAMIMISVGFLFKMMHWPGAGIIIYISNFALLAIIPVSLVKANKETEPQKKLNFYNESIVIILLLSFSILLLFR
jgi:ABC-type multidrug transport system fused ATPase/permease subunit